MEQIYKEQASEEEARNVNCTVSIKFMNDDRDESQDYNFDTMIIMGTKQNGEVIGFAELDHSGVPWGRCQLVGQILAAAELLFSELSRAEQKTALAVKGNALEQIITGGVNDD